jgi:hypothetical protein
MTMTFFIEIETNHKIQMKNQKSQNNKAILREKNKAGVLLLLDFKSHYKARVMKTT